MANPFFPLVMAAVVLKDKMNVGTMIPLIPGIPPAVGFVAAVQTANNQAAELKAKDDQVTQTVKEFTSLLTKEGYITSAGEKLTLANLNKYPTISSLVNRLEQAERDSILKSTT